MDQKVESKNIQRDCSYYPNLYAEENGSGINTTETKTNGIEVSESGNSNFTMPSTETPAYKQATNGLTVTQTYYTIYDGIANYFDSNFYKLIFPERYEAYYWIASRYALCSQEYAEFDYFL